MAGFTWPRGYPSLRALAGLGLLGCAIGVVLEGRLAGAQAGLVAGLLLPFIPLIVARIGAAIRRPDGLPGLLARQISLAAVSGAGRVLEALHGKELRGREITLERVG